MNPNLAQFVLGGVLADNPWLTTFDCPNCPSIEASDFFAAWQWFQVERPHPQRSSYSLKHDAERMRGDHISERAFIAAGIAAGYDIHVEGRSAFFV